MAISPATLNTPRTSITSTTSTITIDNSATTSGGRQVGEWDASQCRKSTLLG
jgi:hypothetical protein